MVVKLDRIVRPIAELSQRVATAPIAAAGLTAGFGVAMVTGSRSLGGVVLVVCGLTCSAVWLQRDGTRTAIGLTAAGLSAFAGSHGLGLVIGPWPAVLVVSAATAGLCWRVSDSRRPAAGLSSAAPPVGSPRTPLRPDRSTPHA